MIIFANDNGLTFLKFMIIYAEKLGIYFETPIPPSSILPPLKGETK